MSTDKELELFKWSRQSQEKYTYFLLAVSLSSIAYTVELTKDLKYSNTIIPVGFAVIFWILSFLCGCCYLMNVMSLTSLNLMEIQKGIRVNEKLRNLYNDKALANFKWQLRTLITGVLSFVIWRVILFIY